ncbi:MAG: hypothetical protein AAGA09_05450 [Pseudomonadota bacterium]
MARWLTSLLILIGFIAIVAFAFVPKNVIVNVQVTSRTSIDHVEYTVNHNGPVGGTDAHDDAKTGSETDAPNDQ